MENERILPPTPYEPGPDNLCGCLFFLLFVVEFIQILSYRNEKNLETDGFNTSSDNPFITTVVLHDTESTFCLDGTVHSEKCSMYAFQVLHDFMMHGGELPVDPDGAIFISFLSSFRIRAPGAVFAGIDLFLTSVVVPLHMLAVLKMERLPVGTTHDAISYNWKVHCAERILMILFICRFLFEHRELHVLFHTILFTEDIVVIRTIAGIRHRILWIEAINVLKALHERYKAVHVRTVLVHIDYCYVFISNTDLDIVCREQLIILNF